MATITHTTYTYACDLCGSEVASRDDVTPVQIKRAASTRLRLDPPSVDICAACESRPFSDVKALLDAAADQMGFRKVRVATA